MNINYIETMIIKQFFNVHFRFCPSFHEKSLKNLEKAFDIQLIYVIIRGEDFREGFKQCITFLQT